MAVNIEKRGRRIEVRSSEPLPGLKTTIPGAYETVAGYWTVPLSLESCKLLRQRYGRRLVLGSELKRWATGVVESRESMAELAASEDAELTVLPKVAPKLYRAMNKRKYQRVGVRFIADGGSGLFDDPGLGKTLIAMGGILESEIPGPYLIVAPKTASDTVWRREILRWLPKEHRPITVPEIRYQREHKLRLTLYKEHTWLIVHPEMVMVRAMLECQYGVEEEVDGEIQEQICGVRTEENNKQVRVLKCNHIKDKRTKRIIEPSYPKLFEIKWGAIVVDESHESLIRRSGSMTQRRRGMELLQLRGDGIKIAMSGTPFESKPHQLWGTLNWLDPVANSAFHRWAELYWQKGGFTGFDIGEFRQDREKMLWDSLKAVALRRTKAEVADDLPPKIHVGSELSPGDPDSPVGIWLEMDGKQARAYQQMEKLSVAELDSGRLEAVSALAELTRLKQLASAYGDIIPVQVRVKCKSFILTGMEECKECARFGYHTEIRHKYIPHLPSNKFDWIAESLEEWGYPKNPITKVIIVSFYTGILEVFREGLEKHFKTKPNRPLCTAITGRTPSKDRRSIIDKFNSSGNEHVMLLNVKAGGTAITIDSADRMIFISETRIPTQQQQAEDRIHRVSNPRHCMYYYLRSLGTVDVGTALVNEEAKRDTHRLLDQRRGVAYLRNVMELSHARR